MTLRELLDFIKAKYHDHGIKFSLILYEQFVGGDDTEMYDSEENGIVFYEKGDEPIRVMHFDYNTNICAVTIITDPKNKKKEE